jgi:hypothetical protein
MTFASTVGGNLADVVLEIRPCGKGGTLHPGRNAALSERRPTTDNSLSGEQSD